MAGWQYNPDTGEDEWIDDPVGALSQSASAVQPGVEARMLAPNQAQVSPAQQMQTDWNSYFSSAQPGQSLAWGGGTLEMNPDGTAKYTAGDAVNGGMTLNRGSIHDRNGISTLMAQAPGIAKQWGSQYGVTSGLNAQDQAYWGSQQKMTAPSLHPEWYGAAQTPEQEAGQRAIFGGKTAAEYAAWQAAGSPVPTTDSGPSYIPFVGPTVNQGADTTYHAGGPGSYNEMQGGEIGGSVQPDVGQTSIGVPIDTTGAAARSRLPMHMDTVAPQNSVQPDVGQTSIGVPIDTTGAAARSRRPTPVDTVEPQNSVYEYDSYGEYVGPGAGGVYDEQGNPSPELLAQVAALPATPVATQPAQAPVPVKTAAPVGAITQADTAKSATSNASDTTGLKYDPSSRQWGTYHTEGQGMDGIHAVFDPAATQPKMVEGFDPVSMGLGATGIGGGPSGGEGGVEPFQQTEWVRNDPADSNMLQHWDMAGNYLGSNVKRSGWVNARDTAVIPLGKMALMAAAPYLAPYMPAAAMGLEAGGMAAAAVNGATMGGLTAGVTGGNIGQGMLTGGLGGAAFNAVGDYLGAGANGGFSDAQIQQNAGYGAFNKDAVDSMLALENINTGYGAFNNDALDTAAINVNSNPTDVRLLENTQTTPPMSAVTPPVTEVAGPLTRTQLDMTTDTAGAPANALDVAKFNNALSAGLNPTDATAYATDPNSTPTDLRLGAGTQKPAGTDDTTGALTTVYDTEVNPTDKRLDGGTQKPAGTNDVQPGVMDKLVDKFKKPDGSVDWSKVLAAAGLLTSVVGKATSGNTTSGTPTSISDLWKSIGKTPGGGTPGTGTVGALSGFGSGFRAGNQLDRLYAADMTSPIRPGVGWSQGGEGVMRLPPGMNPIYVAKPGERQKYAEGGEVEGALTSAAPFVGFVQGPGGGQQDLIDAKLSAGEYVWDAESVSNLGDGNNEEGARKLDELRQNLRAHKRSAPNDKIAPPAQGALSYMNGGQ